MKYLFNRRASSIYSATYYKQYTPSPSLQHVVEHYWHFVSGALE